ncbi:hypothetical protein K488DRAFT_86411 [Vararia minispora EC-137]|uniref:Uncharacterized protein n=1 Tax=Vararia minispora EC-137 TaxID=1314806 RepID=A0ACB8QJL6_9AGAM|nr:hypothetical protein K488DRAFT_86411 [Vararia minispora EC-137]
MSVHVDSTSDPSEAHVRSGPPIQPIRIHFEELAAYLAPYFATGHTGWVIAAQKKLKELDNHQFQDVSTDVYDELIRRKNNISPNLGRLSLLTLLMPALSLAILVPVLPNRPDYHPKRNEARRKLCTLPNSRFERLAVDIYHDIKEGVVKDELDIQ